MGGRPRGARAAACAALLALCGLGAAAAQQPGGVNLGGILQTNLAALQWLGGPIDEQFDLAGSSILTLNLRTQDNRRARLDASVDLTLLYGRSADALRRSGAHDLAWAPAEGLGFLVDVRKLYGALYFRWADLSAGRQIITFGQGMVFSPIDVFSAVDALDLGLKRGGSDVVRVKIPFGALAGADVVAKITSRSQGATAAAKCYWNLGGFDLSAVGMYKGAEEEIVSGLAFKGDLLLGVWAEAVEHWSTHGQRYFVGMAGADYSVANRWFVALEYQYNGRPSPPESLFVSSVRGGGPLPGRHSAFASTRFTINDLMSVSLSGLFDLEQGYGFATAQYSYNVLQNVNASVYGRCYVFDAVPGLATLVPDAEYGLRADLAF